MAGKNYALFATLALALSAGACTGYHINYKGSLPGGGKVVEEKANFFLYGWLGDADVDLESRCPQGVARAASRQSFTDGLLYVLTGGLYTPMTVTIECAGRSAMTRLLRTPVARR